MDSGRPAQTWRITWLAGALTFLCIVPAAARDASPAAMSWDRAPQVLPSVSAAGSTTAASGEPAQWIIGARRGAVSDRVAERYGARPLATGDAFVVPRSRARAMARSLRRHRRLLYAEPDIRLRHASAFDDHLDAWARAAVVPPTLAPPAPGAASIAVIDDRISPAAPDVAPLTRYINDVAVTGPHGTMVASAAAGLAGNGGVTGIFPGAPLLSFGLDTLTCDRVSEGVLVAAEQHATAINLSLGSSSNCFTLFRAIAIAYASGSLVIAAGGNEYLAGNPISYPAAYPHVLSVAALNPDGTPADFSNANTAIDLAAPGVAVPVATPPEFDDDGTVDGVTLADGTSFAAPIVAGAAAWLKTARPDLQNGQIADILRNSASDVAPPGWDTDSGFGLIQLPAALSAPAPAIDPLEPNDGITFVDGTAFGRADPFIWGGGVPRLLRASVDAVEDPVDVYRIRIPARAAFGAILSPSHGDPDMVIYDGSARYLDDTRRIIGSRPRGPGRPESLALVNQTRTARRAYVAIMVDVRSSHSLSAGYRLEILRLRRHG